MQFNSVKITQNILKHPYFKKAKQVREISPGHTEDSVYTHLIQTANFIRENINGDFIHNTEAKNLFCNYMNRKVDGVLYSDIAILIGLVHDIGKILWYEEEGRIFSINQKKPNENATYNPNHGYYGSIIIEPLLKEVGVSGKLIDYIVRVVRLHLIPFEYYSSTKGYAITEVIDDLKPRMEGLHIEVCINAYGDIAYNLPLRECWELLGKMFEESHFYSKRKYFVE